MRLVAGRTTLLEGRLVQVLFRPQSCLVSVAAQAYVHGVWLRQPGGFGGMRIVTIRAIAHRSGMLNLGFVDLFRLIGVAGKAQLPWARRCQGDLAVLQWLVAGAAGAAAAIERRVHHGLHQLGTVRLVRIMALKTIGFRERLIVVRFLQRSIVAVVTIKAEPGSGLL